MKVEDFLDIMYKKHGDKYGILPPPISDKEGLEILVKHFLGDYYSVNPISHEQFNTEAILRILEQYPVEKKDNIVKRFFTKINVSPRVKCDSCLQESKKTINYGGVNICSEKCMMEYFKNISTEELLKLDKKDREVNSDYHRWINKGKEKRK